MKQKIWGLILLALGILVLLQVTEVFNFGLAFWPVLLLLIGVTILWESLSHRITSWFLLGLGLWVGGIGLFGILANAGATVLDGSDIARYGWPLILVAIGLSILIGDRSGHSRRRWFHRADWFGEDWGETYTEMRHIGDLYHGRTPWVLNQNLDFYHGIGDVVIDLTTADIQPGTHRIFVKTGIGELDIKVPDGINVEVEGSVGLGELNLFGEKRSGFAGLSMRKTLEAPAAEATVILEAKLGIGELNVTYAPAIPGGLR